MSTLAERLHRLVPDEPIEVAWETNQGTRIAHGRFERVGRDAFGDEAIFYRRVGTSHDVPNAALRYVRSVDPAHIAAGYRVGERVVVRKYSSDYTGTVVKIARTRLTVRITLGAGTSRQREREVTVSSLDARRPELGVLW